MENVRDGVSAEQGWRGSETGSPGSLATAFRSEPASPDVVRERLNTVMESDVIPRLLLAHCVSATDPAPAHPLVPHVDEFTALTLGDDAARAADCVQRLRAAGVDVDRLYVDLLAPAARRLGVMWTADEVDFVDVTVALSRLQQILHTLSGVGGPTMTVADPRKRILLAPAPGEQHTFGLSMVGSIFGEAGWSVTIARGTAQDVLRLLRRETFGVVGFSLSCELKIEALASTIRKVRKATRNPAIGVLVGGRVFAEKPETAVLIGADATAPDGATGVLMAQSLLDLRARAC